jgi:hypothetical protein
MVRGDLIHSDPAEMMGKPIMTVEIVRRRIEPSLVMARRRKTQVQRGQR